MLKFSNKRIRGLNIFSFSFRLSPVSKSKPFAPESYDYICYIQFKKQSLLAFPLHLQQKMITIARWLFVFLLKESEKGIPFNCKGIPFFVIRFDSPPPKQ